jgi:3-hydroxyisobutyrate dehydrogenase-like beta-hydroxyacid dehydrogenase
MKIAVIGTGVLGTGVGHTLLARGHAVRCYNRTPAHAQPLVDAGATACASPREAAEAASHVLLLVWDEAALRAVLDGPDGLFAAASPGQVFIDMSTQLPSTAQAQARRFAERGALFVDAPVHGSKAEAHAGGLWVMAGADDEAWAAALPVLQAISATQHRMGPVGAGCAAKLCGNHLVSTMIAALAESLALARKSGLDGHQLLDVWRDVDFRSPIIEGAGRSMWDGEFGVSFHLRTMAKDSELIHQHAETVAAPVLLANTVHELNKIACNLGYGELNATAIFKLCDLLAGSGSPSST